MSTQKTTTGLPKNASAALAYFLGPITGVVFLLIEKDSFVRFHAMQSIVVFAGLFVLQTIMGVLVIFIPFIPLVTILGFVLWLLLMFKAYQGERWEVPFAGKYASQFLSKI